jgi:hypothetical protein
METISKKRPASKLVMTSPGMYVKLQGKSEASTKLGALAQSLTDQTAITAYSVAATTGFVYAIMNASTPQVNFQDVPPGMTSTLAQLQSAYNGFQTNFAIFQGQASAWINTQQGSAAPSIFSQLVSIPNTLNNINGSVTSNFAILNSLTPGTTAYQTALANQETLIGAESSAITSLLSLMETLGTQLETGSASLITSTQSGVLSQMLAAYNTDIQTLQTDITNATNQISSDNSKIIGLGFAAGASIAVGLLGLLNFWNPIGWIMIAGGVVGAYFSITEIEMLKAQIASLKNQIQTDTMNKTQDEQAALVLSAFCNLLQGFASMNAATQAELTELENLYSTLSSDIATAVSDLQSNELDDAQAEWNTILQEAQFLTNLSAYIWPSPTLLSAPNMFAAVGNDIYNIATSGEMYHYSGSANAWTNMGVTGLSCAGQGTTLIAIDGAPVNGTATGNNPAASTYFVKSYNMSTQTWTNISTFPAAAIAVESSGVFAISQIVNDRNIYQYSGSGTNWTALTQLPGPDAAIQIAVAGNVVFALANNSQFVYQYNSSNNTWTQVGNYTCNSIVGNGNKLAIQDTSNNEYLYDPTIGGDPIGEGADVSLVAQLTDGTQFRISCSNQSLWFADTNANPTTYTNLEPVATAVFCSDTNVTYYADNLGNLFMITSAGVNTLLPPLPNS